MNMNSASDAFFTKTRGQGSLRRSKSEGDIAEVSNRVMADAQGFASGIKGSAIHLTTAEKKELVDLKSALEKSQSDNKELTTMLREWKDLSGKMLELEKNTHHAETLEWRLKNNEVQLQLSEVQLELNKVQLQLERLMAENADLKKRDDGIEKHDIVEWLLG